MTTTAIPTPPVFTRGDKVVVTAGNSQGNSGTFISLRDDPKWADISGPGGELSRHPLSWLSPAVV